MSIAEGMKITFTATYVVVGGVILRSIQRRSMPVSAQTDEVKGLEWECIARWFVSVVLVTAAEVCFDVSVSSLVRREADGGR